MAIWNCNMFSSGKNWEICIEMLNWSQSFADWFPWCPLSSSHLFDFVCCYLFFWSATLSSGYVHDMHVICPEQTMILHLSLSFPVFYFAIETSPRLFLISCLSKWSYKNKENVFSSLESVIYLQVYFKRLDKL